MRNISMNFTAEINPKKRSEQRRSQETRSKILKAALVEFASSGFEGVSVREIAARAGVNHTLISHHFGGKEALWKAIAEWVFKNYNKQSLDRKNALKGLEPSVLIRILLKDFIEFSAKFPDFYRFMMQANQNDSERLNWLVDRFLRKGADDELSIIKQAQDLGLMPEGDSLHMRYLFIGAATSIFTFAHEFSRLTGKDSFSDSMIDQHVNYVLALFNQNNSITTP